MVVEPDWYCYGPMEEQMGVVQVESYADQFVRGASDDVLLDVTVGDGKYRVVQASGAGLQIFRHGEAWRTETGDKLILALAQEVATLRGVQGYAPEKVNVDAEREKRLERQKGRGWIGVDLDGTLARYDGWVAWNVIGEPISAMVERVKKWLADGHDVRIMTARVSFSEEDSCRVSGEKFSVNQMTKVIQDYCAEHVGQRLPVTATKDVAMIELWDDRAVQVVPNTGRTLAEEHAAELAALRGGP